MEQQFHLNGRSIARPMNRMKNVDKNRTMGARNEERAYRHRIGRRQLSASQHRINIMGRHLLYRCFSLNLNDRSVQRGVYDRVNRTAPLI